MLFIGPDFPNKSESIDAIQNGISSPDKFRHPNDANLGPKEPLECLVIAEKE